MADGGATPRPLVEVEDLAIHFPIHKGVFRRQVGAIKAVGTVEDLVARMEREYHEAKARMLANSNYTSWADMAEAAE